MSYETDPIILKVSSAAAQQDLDKLNKAFTAAATASNKAAQGIKTATASMDAALNKTSQSIGKFAEVTALLGKIRIASNPAAGIMEMTKALNGLSSAGGISGSKIKNLEAFARAITSIRPNGSLASLAALSNFKGPSAASVKNLSAMLSVFEKQNSIPGAAQFAKDLELIAGAAGRAGTALSSLPQRMRTFNGAASTVSSTARGYGTLGKALSGLPGQFNLVSQAATLFAGSLSIFGLEAFVKGVFEAETSMLKLQKAMLFSSNTFAGAAAGMQQYVGIEQKLGLSISENIDAYGRFSIAAHDLNLTLDQSNKIYSSVEQALVVIGSSSEQAGQALYGLQEMMSKGVVSMKELNRQIGQQLPGSVVAGARALSVMENKQVSVGEFLKKVRSGTLQSAIFVPEWAKQIDSMYAPLLSLAQARPDVALTRLGNALTVLRAGIGQGSFMTAIATSLNDLTAKIVTVDKSGVVHLTASAKQLADSIGKTLAQAVEVAGKVFGFLADHVSGILVGIRLFASYEIGKTLIGWGTSAVTAARGLMEFATAQRAVNAATSGGSAGARITSTTGKLSLGVGEEVGVASGALAAGSALLRFAGVAGLVAMTLTGVYASFADVVVGKSSKNFDVLISDYVYAIFQPIGKVLSDIATKIGNLFGGGTKGKGYVTSAAELDAMAMAGDPEAAMLEAQGTIGAKITKKAGEHADARNAAAPVDPAVAAAHKQIEAALAAEQKALAAANKTGNGSAGPGIDSSLLTASAILASFQGLQSGNLKTFGPISASATAGKSGVSAQKELLGILGKTNPEAQAQSQYKDALLALAQVHDSAVSEITANPGSKSWLADPKLLGEINTALDRLGVEYKKAADPIGYANEQQEKANKVTALRIDGLASEADALQRKNDLLAEGYTAAEIALMTDQKTVDSTKLVTAALDAQAAAMQARNDAAVSAANIASDDPVVRFVNGKIGEYAKANGMSFDAAKAVSQQAVNGTSLSAIWAGQGRTETQTAGSVALDNLDTSARLANRSRGANTNAGKMIQDYRSALQAVSKSTSDDLNTLEASAVANLGQDVIGKIRSDVASMNSEILNGFAKWADAVEPFATKLEEIKANFMEGLSQDLTDLFMGKKVDFGKLPQNALSQIVKSQTDNFLKSVLGGLGMTGKADGSQFNPYFVRMVGAGGLPVGGMGGSTTGGGITDFLGNLLSGQGGGAGSSSTGILNFLGLGNTDAVQVTPQSFSAIADAGSSSGGLGDMLSSAGSWISSFFADGGYTGPGGKYQPAGIVHAGEYVMNQEAVKRIGVSTLDSIQNGYANGGYVGPVSGGSSSGGSGGDVHVTVNNNNGSHVQTTTRKGPDGSKQIEMTIVNTVAKHMQGGSFDTVLGNSFGMARSGTPR